MSWVFLAGERVYKLKKPVKYPFLDFSTLRAREADCLAEMSLNRRLAPNVYLGVVPLTREEAGRLALDGMGEIVDWLVLMRRIPEEKMLDRAIAAGRVTAQHIDGVARVLARFYRSQPPAGVTAGEHVALFAREQALNRALLMDERFDLPRARVEAVLAGIEGLIAAEPGLLAARVTEGRIVEGHGDLRPEHVCLTEPPAIIDCLEFNRSLRLVDPFDELSFLAVECELLGAGWIGGALIGRTSELLGERPPERLLAFYTAYRACLRARLSVAHLVEPEPRTPEKWEPQARAYLAIAERASIRLAPRGVPPASRPRGSGG